MLLPDVCHKENPDPVAPPTRWPPGDRWYCFPVSSAAPLAGSFLERFSSIPASLCPSIVDQPWCATTQSASPPNSGLQPHSLHWIWILTLEGIHSPKSCSFFDYSPSALGFALMFPLIPSGLISYKSLIFYIKLVLFKFFKKKESPAHLSTLRQHGNRTPLTYSTIRSFIQQLLYDYFAPGTVLEVLESAVNKIKNKSLTLYSVYHLREDTK